MSDLQTAVDIAGRSAASAQNSAMNHTHGLMIQHLRDEHGHGPYTIARRLKLKVNYVKEVLGIE